MILGGARLIATDAEVFESVGVADDTTGTVGIGVFVEFGTLVLVGSGVFVAVGMDGKLAGFPGKVREFISWMLLNPSLSESKFSIKPKAARFLPLDL